MFSRFLSQCTQLCVSFLLTVKWQISGDDRTLTTNRLHCFPTFLSMHTLDKLLVSFFPHSMSDTPLSRLLTGRLLSLSKIEIVFEPKPLSCYFTAPTTTASSSTALPQESRPVSTYQVQCFTAACKAASSFTQIQTQHLWLAVMRCVEYHRSLTKAWLVDSKYTFCNSQNMVDGSVSQASPILPSSPAAH